MSPSFCTEAYSLTVPDAIKNVLTYDEEDQQFKLGPILDSLALSGSSSNLLEQTYSVSLLYSVGNGVETTDSETVTFDLKIKNPCVKPGLVDIVLQSTFTDFDYSIS